MITPWCKLHVRANSGVVPDMSECLIRAHVGRAMGGSYLTVHEIGLQKTLWLPMFFTFIYKQSFCVIFVWG